MPLGTSRSFTRRRVSIAYEPIQPIARRRARIVVGLIHDLGSGERLSEHTVSLNCRRSGHRRVLQWVERHERMDGTEITGRRHGHSCVHQFASISLALISDQIELRGDDECRRLSAQLFRRSQRRSLSASRWR
jgi:hypothetical protein